MQELRGIHRGQVTDVHSEDNSVLVILFNFSRAEGIRVKVTGDRRHIVAGNYALPEPSNWGVTDVYGTTSTSRAA